METSTKPPVPFGKIKGEDYDDGQVVLCIAGTITGLYEAKKGETTNGPWEFQNGTMKDAEGTEIGISFSKNTQPMTAKGKKVTIRSVKSDQHGWNGVKVEDQKYTPKGKDEEVTKRVLKITASAEIIYDGGAAQKPSNPAQSKPSDTSNTHPENVLADIVNLHTRCAHYIGQAYPDSGEGAISPEARQAFVSSVFIQACRQGLDLNYMDRASKPVPPKITPAPSDPKQWATCMIPTGSKAGKTLKELDDEQMKKLYDSCKDSKTAFGKCVQQAAEDRGLLKQEQEENAALEPEGDDVPF